MNLHLWWPIGLIVFSNVFYHICSKQTPSGIQPLAALTVTYLVSAAASGILYFLLTPHPDLLREYRFAALFISWVWMSWYNGFEVYAAPAFFLLACYNGKRGKQSKYFFYFFYPAHLLVLWLVRRYLYGY